MQAIAETVRPTRGEAITKVLEIVAVLGATIFVIWQLRPDLLFGPSMDVGGDNAGHVVTPYFLIHDLLPQGRITGWDPQWFEGFPLYVFYFPLPALFVAAFSVVFPYAVAFKLVTVLGPVTLPVAAWAFGRLADFKRPIPALMAMATLPFLFNTSYTIEGGNLTSTLAGEFSYALALTSGLLFLGVFAYALRTGRLRWLAAALYGVTLLCHVVPPLGYAAIAILLALSHWNRNTWRVLIPVGAVGALLAAFWLVPFAADLPYSSSMGYTRVTGVWSNIFPHDYLWMIFPAGLGAFIAIIRRDRTTFALVVATVAAVAGFQWLPAGFVYNGRWLPFYFLLTALLAAYGVGELFRLGGRWLELRRLAGTFRGRVRQRRRPARRLHRRRRRDARNHWIAWNYSGFQGKTGWPVYQGIVRMLDQAGKTYGCGRLQYEYITETNYPFGSTEATMALPYWTNGCMDTIDGVLFESSTTTPFHFLDQAEYSLPGESSNPVSFLNYPAFDLADGIRHLQFEDVRYFLAVSPQVEAAAKDVPGLVKIASDPGFRRSDRPSDGAASRLGPLSDQRLATRDTAPLPPRCGIRWDRQTVARHKSRLVGGRDLLAGRACPERAPELAQGSSRVGTPRLPGYNGAADDGDGHPHDELDRELQRRAPWCPGAREGALFPQLARHRSPRAIRGLSEPHGSRADGTSRHPQLRHDGSRPARQARLPWWHRRPGRAHHAAPACDETTAGFP